MYLPYRAGVGECYGTELYNNNLSALTQGNNNSSNATASNLETLMTNRVHLYTYNLL